MKIGIERHDNRIPLARRSEYHIICDPRHPQVANVFGHNVCDGQMSDS
jgi:hypothetical protein